MLQNSKIVLGVFAIAVFFSSCDALRKLPTADNDDVYLDPKKDRAEFYKADQPKPTEAVAAETVPVVDETAKNNPYYNDKDFSYDDYYDNQYASRLKRFHNPTYGVGYYDSYYTNSYFYNYNPYQYGVSIYNGYSFWGPSYNNYSYVPNYNWNGYYGYGSNYGYSSYCNNGWNGPGPGYYGYGSPYYNNWYNPYSYNNNYYGYNNGWNNPYGYGYGNNGYNNYGYNNSYDYNSYTYNGPRVSHSGGNSKQVINPGMGPMKLMAPNGTTSTGPSGVASTDIKRFNVVESPKEGYIKGNTNNANTSVPHTIHPANGTTTVTSQPATQPVKGKTEVLITPVGSNNATTTNETPKPKGNFNGGQLTTPSNNNTPSTPVVNEPVKPKKGLFNGSEPAPPSNPEPASNPKPVKKGGFFNNGNNSGGNNNSNNNNSGGNNNSKPAYTPSVPSNGGGGRSGGGNTGGVIKPR